MRLTKHMPCQRTATASKCLNLPVLVRERGDAGVAAGCPRADSGQHRGRPQDQKRRTPAGLPRMTTSAGRDANNPTVTTPTIWLISVSSATGSSMRRPWTSMM